MFKINYKSDTIELNDVEFSCKKCASMFLMWCDESKIKFYEQQVREDKELEEFREKNRQKLRKEFEYELEYELKEAIQKKQQE